MSSFPVRPGTVDYSKFDSVDCSDSSDDDKQGSNGRGGEECVAAAAADVMTPTHNISESASKDGISIESAGDCSPGGGPDEKVDTGRERRVTLHPDDDGVGLHPVFLEDPRTYVPFEHREYSATFGRPVRWRWGLPDEYDAEGIPEDDREAFRRAVRVREMEKQFMYGRGGPRMPQEQFVSILAERKRGDLKKARERRKKRNCGKKERRDLVLRVYLVDHGDGMKSLRPSIYRRVKVSSRLKLSVLADKVLTPLMGWVRNYHSYYFCDLFDGSIWCPQEHGSNDGSMHFQLRCGGDSLRPSETGVGELLRKVGDRIAWVHDLGDHFTHVIEVEKVIKDEAEADGRCVVLEGEMRCPPEDCDGCHKYQEVLDMYYKSRQHPFDDEMQRKRSETFYDYRKLINVLGRFDPEEFDLAERQRAVSNALRSRMSPLTEPKTFTGSGQAFGGLLNLGSSPKSLPRHCKPGQIIQETTFSTDRDELANVVMSEVVNIKPDLPIETVCVCGNPLNLTQCSRCKCMWFCSKACQIEDWKVHKKECKVFKRQLETHQSNQPITLPPMKPRSREKELRFTVGTRVECQVGDNDFRKGQIVATDYRETSWPMSKEAAPYQIRVDGGLIWSPVDDDYFVRALPVQAKEKSKKKKKGKSWK